jgi:hypothetical protein
MLDVNQTKGAPGLSQEPLWQNRDCDVLLELEPQLSLELPMLVTLCGNRSEVQTVDTKRWLGCPTHFPADAEAVHVVGVGGAV